MLYFDKLNNHLYAGCRAGSKQDAPCTCPETVKDISVLTSSMGFRRLNDSSLAVISCIRT
jgi:hypothetical protein